ncbi:DUF2244 domain-containing protein [Noviherbaspirillum sp. UKPF54]|nr:DUF2244 domain-containing protein [Noviherbaspirillum sp. UKPF54]
MARREWVIRRNCSMSPRQLASAYSALCAMSLAVAVFFTLHGAWYVLAFSILEISAVGGAFVQFGRHANDHERILLMDNCLLVEVVRADRVRQFRLDPHATRIALPAKPGSAVALEANGIKVEVGRFLTEWKRREFAGELKSALAS